MPGLNLYAPWLVPMAMARLSQPVRVHEFLDVLGTGVGAVLGLDVDVVLHARKRAELGLDDDAVVVRVFDDLAGEGDVVLEGLAAAVDHDGGEAAVDAALAKLKAVAVVQMQGDRKTGLLARQPRRA